MPRSNISIPRMAAVSVLVLLLVVVAFVIGRGHSVPSGPEPVAWNRQACAHCRMLVGDPTYAAQLITEDGDVFHFDDPGCLMRFLDERTPRVHRLWFHDSRGDRWLAGEHVGFVTGATTPMGYGLAAVERGTPGAMDLDAARRLVGAHPLAVAGDMP